MEGERGKRVVESLGWLTESAVMPKKHRAIEGVGASSIVELKAQLYRTQEQARKAKESSAVPDSEFLRAKQKPLPHDLFSHKNSGVDSRARKDKLEMKAITDGSVSYSALERKAEIYDKLARGELPDEEEKEKYCVDFSCKRIDQYEPEPLESHDTHHGAAHENGDGRIDDAPLNAIPMGPGRTGTLADHDEHKRFVREVHEEANQEREKATTLKLRRQEQEAVRREKLRQAYLRKKLEKLTSSKQTAGDS